MTATFSADQIADQIQRIRASIPDTVRLIAVSKFHPAEAIRAAYQAGIRDFGENRVQEALAKQTDLSDLPDITWHLIGHLQSNKARKALQHFAWIHSVDSWKLAKRLDQLAAEEGCYPRCCLQVKMVPDPPKYGFDLPDLLAQLTAIDQLQHLNIVGLMTIPPENAEADEIQDIFQRTQQLAEQINQTGYENLHITDLSMGMSGDYQIAIDCGATWVRLGTLLFGPRPASMAS